MTKTHKMGHLSNTSLKLDGNKICCNLLNIKILTNTLIESTQLQIIPFTHICVGYEPQTKLDHLKQRLRPFLFLLLFLYNSTGRSLPLK